MPVIKVTDIAYGKLRSPDLDAQEEFLTHFGMVRADRTKNALYMRGTDPAHHIHVTEQGDPGFIGMAFYTASEEDLHRVARVPGASGDEVRAALHAREAPGIGHPRGSRAPMRFMSLQGSAL
jgi:hypothetical protein